jgi:hypothetical protein
VQTSVTPPAMPVSVSPAPVGTTPPEPSIGRERSHAGHRPDPQPTFTPPRF